MSGNTKRLERKMKQAGRRAGRKEILAHMKTMEEHMKPKPLWVPDRLWRWGMKIFIKV